MDASSSQTPAQALARAEDLIRQTAGVLRPRPRLEPLAGQSTSSPCLEPHDDGAQDRIVVSRAYWLREVPGAANMEIARQVMDHWQRQGHVITSTGGFQVGHPSVGGVSRPDGFILALVWSEGDRLYLAATSPCVSPDGMPQP